MLSRARHTLAILEDTMTIREIKRRVAATGSHFFDADAMRFFGQTLNDFSVTPQADGRYRIIAPMRNCAGKSVGTTLRYFRPDTDQLEFV